MSGCVNVSYFSLMCLFSGVFCEPNAFLFVKHAFRVSVCVCLPKAVVDICRQLSKYDRASIKGRL